LNPDLKEISGHMLGLGLGALAHAVWHAAYYSMENDKWAELSVLQAAHAAEILIKARIAEEHPLLIFEDLPRSKKAGGGLLELRHLVENGKTIQYSDLPERLWAITGLTVPSLDTYQAFGRLRNTIQHFAPPEATDCSQETLEFIFQVIDPLIAECWDLYAIDFNEDHEPYVYLMESLVARGILFRVSEGAAKDFEHVRADWPKDSPQYRTEMDGRIAKVLGKISES
jgi:hypothetical protein